MILTYEVSHKGPASIATRKQRWQKGQVYTTTDREVVAYVKANPEVFTVLHEVQRHASAPAPAPAAKPAPLPSGYVAIPEPKPEPEVAPGPKPEPEAPVKAKPKPKPKPKKAQPKK